MIEDKSNSETKKSWTYDDFPEIEEDRKQWEKERLIQRIFYFNKRISELATEMVYQGFNVLTTRTHDELPLLRHKFNKHSADGLVSYHLETELDDNSVIVILTKYENDKTMCSTEYVNCCLDEIAGDTVSKFLPQ